MGVMRKLREKVRPLVPVKVRWYIRHRLMTGYKGVSLLSYRVWDARLTYLGAEKLWNIERALQEISRERVAGNFLECGLALGGSGIVIASLMPPGRQFHGYDVFGMIPPPTSEKDDEKSKNRYQEIASGNSEGIRGDVYYGYVEDLLSQVKGSFSRFGVPVDERRVFLHKGLFEDTLKLEGPVAFAHIDCDWYNPVKLCLERICPHLSPGGQIVLDDYNGYGGCKVAVDEFLDATPGFEVVVRAPNFIIRKRHG